MSTTMLKDNKEHTLPELGKEDSLLNGATKDGVCSKELAVHNNSSVSTSNSDQPNAVTDGAECNSIDVEYRESENLTDLADVNSTADSLIARLGSKEWVTICEALNNVRQLAIYHKEIMLEMLTQIISLVVKSLKNPRSAVCKTAIMTCADIFKAYGDIIVDSIDPLLLQLFLKSSQDKRFVCEAAESALIVMTSSIPPSPLLLKLQPYLKNKNPRIRAKASMCFSRSIFRLDIEGIQLYGIDNLIQIAANQLNDQLPESREAARSMALGLQSLYEKSQSVQREAAAEQPEAVNTWEEFCQAKLSPLNAQAILRVTAASRECVTVGC